MRVSMSSTLKHALKHGVSLSPTLKHGVSLSMTLKHGVSLSMTLKHTLKHEHGVSLSVTVKHSLKHGDSLSLKVLLLVQVTLFQRTLPPVSTTGAGQGTFPDPPLLDSFDKLWLCHYQLLVRVNLLQRALPPASETGAGQGNFPDPPLLDSPVEVSVLILEVLLPMKFLCTLALRYAVLASHSVLARSLAQGSGLAKIG